MLNKSLLFWQYCFEFTLQCLIFLSILNFFFTDCCLNCKHFWQDEPVELTRFSFSCCCALTQQAAKHHIATLPWQDGEKSHKKSKTQNAALEEEKYLSWQNQDIYSNEKL